MVSWLETQKSPVLDAGLGTGIFLETDVLITPWSLQDGVLELGTPELNLETVEAVRANATRTTWWFERLERCVALL
jgi:O-succinylbenzoate synthase